MAGEDEIDTKAHTQQPLIYKGGRRGGANVVPPGVFHMRTVRVNYTIIPDIIITTNTCMLISRSDI